MVETGTPDIIDPRVIHWLKGAPEQNFGDYLSELFVQRLLGYAKVEVDAFHLVGSVIDDGVILRDLRATSGSRHGRVAFWGCGVRDEAGISVGLRSKILLCGVRGPLTREVLGLPETTVLGDPGLLVPLLLTPRVDSSVAGRTICIPHFHDHRPKAELLALAETDLLVSPRIEGNLAALDALLNTIANAKFVLTASLHGAIVAAAFGVPFAYWGNGHIDLPFKWRDFSLSAGFETAFPETLKEGERFYRDAIRPTLALPPLTPLLEACPFTVQPSMLLRALVADGLIEAADAAPMITALAKRADEASRHRLLATSLEYRRTRLTPRATLDRWLEKTALSARTRFRRMIG